MKVRIYLSGTILSASAPNIFAPTRLGHGDICKYVPGLIKNNLRGTSRLKCSVAVLGSSGSDNAIPFNCASLMSSSSFCQDENCLVQNHTLWVNLDRES